MADEELSALLPEPPPPRNARRDAAIEAAMLRFDGVETTAAPPSRVEKPARWSLFARPQVGALLTAALVGVIAVPIWLANGDHLTPRPPARPAAEPTAPVEAPSAQPSPVSRQGAEPALPAAGPSSPGAKNSQPARTVTRIESENLEELPAPAEPAPLPPPAPPPPPVAAPAPEPAPAPQMAGRAVSVSAEDSAREIIVTGAKRAAPRGFAERAESRRARAADRATEHGPWDACTVRDPARDLSACKRLMDPAARGRSGRAAAQVADGLTAAWRGDDGAAIAAFDRAIDQSPGLALAWLNRGLARERQGDTGRALADLDKAVRLGPNAARSYYQRSLFLSRQGETRRAREDWERAVKLDPRLDSDDE